jgi:hypothetical protein
MGAFAGPDIAETGLVLALDAADFNSFRGQSIDNMYYISYGSSANSSIWHMPMGGTATGTYTTSHSYGTWNGNTIFEVTVSAGTIPGGYESFRDCISASLNATYGSTRRLTAKVRMIKGTIATLGVHNGGGNGGGTYTTFNEYLVPKDVNIKDGWYLLDTDVSGSYPFGQCVGIGILSADIKFLVTEMMVHNTSNSVRFTPTTRGTTVATGGGWADLIGRGNNGELINGVKESGDNGGSLSFDGTNDYIQSQSFVPNITNKTLSGWVKLNSTTQQGGGLINLQSDDGVTFDAIVYNETDQGWGFGSNGFTRTGWSNVKETSTNQWVNIVATYENLNYKMYRNGNLILTLTSFNTLNYNFSSKSLIGYRHTGGSNAYLNANISQVSIYNRALSAAEVSQNFNMMRGRFGI